MKTLKDLKEQVDRIQQSLNDFLGDNKLQQNNLSQLIEECDGVDLQICSNGYTTAIAPGIHPTTLDSQLKAYGSSPEEAMKKLIIKKKKHYE